MLPPSSMTAQYTPRPFARTEFRSSSTGDRMLTGFVAACFIKMFLKGLRACKAVPRFANGIIRCFFRRNIGDSDSATMHLAIDGMAILWPLSIYMRNALNLNQRVKG